MLITNCLVTSCKTEITAVEKVMKETERPFTAIMGGSKVSSKIEIIQNLLDKVDNLILAGGMTYTFSKHSVVTLVPQLWKMTNSTLQKNLWKWQKQKV